MEVIIDESFPQLLSSAWTHTRTRLLSRMQPRRVIPSSVTTWVEEMEKESAEKAEDSIDAKKSISRGVNEEFHRLFGFTRTLRDSSIASLEEIPGYIPITLPFLNLFRFLVFLSFPVFPFIPIFITPLFFPSIFNTGKGKISYVILF